jgi:hypothetical protein
MQGIPAAVYRNRDLSYQLFLLFVYLHFSVTIGSVRKPGELIETREIN